MRNRLSLVGSCYVALLVVLLTGLAGCASNTIDVTRRISLSAVGKDDRFIVLLSDEEEADPAYVRDAQTLVRTLEEKGLVAADKSADARYAVMLALTTPGAHHDREQSSSGDGRAGGGGRGGGGRGGGFGGGGGFGHHGGHSMASSGSSEPDRNALRLAIFDLTKPRSSKERVFYAEVHAPAKQQGDDITDAMIEAALRNFPGKPKESYSEPVPPKPKNSVEY